MPERIRSGTCRCPRRRRSGNPVPAGELLHGAARRVDGAADQRATFGHRAPVLRAAVIRLQSAKNQMLRRGDPLRQVHRGRTGGTPQRPAPTSISTRTVRRCRHPPPPSRSPRPALRRRHTRRPCDARQRAKARQLRRADDLVADQDVGDAAPGERLGLRHLLYAVADRATRHLQPGDDRRFVRLRVRPQLHPGRRQQLRHVVEVGLERVQIDQQRGRVDLVLAHAGSGWRRLQHGYLIPLAATGGACLPARSIRAAVLPFAVPATTRLRR